jgi:choline dehydrogenase-like flavoprotein
MPGRSEFARERAVLAAIARGVLGEVYDSNVPDEIIETFARVPSEADRKKVFSSLRLLDTKLGARALTGKGVPVSWLSAAEAEALLQKWKRSRLAGLRQLAGALISASVAGLYGHPGPEWKRIRYPGPYGSAPDAPRRLQPIELERDEVIGCDVVIVGSGPGGGCVASHLARAGLDVVILEKGGYYSESDFHHYESQSHRDLYLYGGTLATQDGGVRILSGSTLGGGAVVNYTISFHTPPRVREQWAAISGLDMFVSGEFEESLDECATRLNVNRDSSALNARERFVEEGLKHLGWHVDQMPRAVKACPQDEQCGYCGFGCRHGAKQGPRVYLEEAAEHGARIVTRAEARRVLIRDGRAIGIEGRAGRHELRVHASKAVVVAAGAIESPALLLRSGLKGQVGHHLHLHPGTGIWARFDEEARPWEGVQMARYSDEIREWDDGYGPIYESVPIHPGAFATVVPWTSAAEHRDLMETYPNTSLLAPLARDKTEGRVTIDKSGAVQVDYTLGADDERRVLESVLRGAKVFEAAGAKEIWSTHTRRVSYHPDRAGDYDRWAGELRTIGYKPDTSLFASYHQMGSCRMGVDPSSSAVDGTNRSHEVSDLYVTDGSNFPDASGVNPMLSIFGIANLAGRKLAERLG